MSDEKKNDGLIVKAASVTVLRQVGAGMAWVDVPQGESVDGLDDETRDRLLASGAIGKPGDGKSYSVAARPVPGEVEPDEIDKDIIPAGSVEQILGWVGDDLARARVAREMEEAKGPKARATLLAKLDEVKQSVETEPPTVPEAYDPNIAPAAGGVVTPVDDSAVDGKTAEQAPAGDAGTAKRRS